MIEEQKFRQVNRKYFGRIKAKIIELTDSYQQIKTEKTKQLIVYK